MFTRFFANFTTTFLSEIMFSIGSLIFLGDPNICITISATAAMVSSLQLPAATASTMSTTVATANDIDVHRHESQDPLRPRVGCRVVG